LHFIFSSKRPETTRFWPEKNAALPNFHEIEFRFHEIEPRENETLSRENGALAPFEKMKGVFCQNKTKKPIFLKENRLVLRKPADATIQSFHIPMILSGLFTFFHESQTIILIFFVEPVHIALFILLKNQAQIYEIQTRFAIALHFF